MIAVQTMIGGNGEKATTELSLSFASMCSSGGFQFGANSSGIHLLNTGTKDNNVSFESSFTMATTDLGISNAKRLRYLYIGIETDNDFSVSIKGDKGVWEDYKATPAIEGLQMVRVPIGRIMLGRYVTVKISSSYPFRVDQIDCLPLARPLGVRGV